MNNYETVKSALIKLCRQEDLQFIETGLENKKTEFFRKGNAIVLNRNYHKYREYLNTTTA